MMQMQKLRVSCWNLNFLLLAVKNIKDSKSLSQTDDSKNTILHVVFNFVMGIIMKTAKMFYGIAGISSKLTRL